MKVTIEIPREVLEKFDRLDGITSEIQQAILDDYVQEVCGLMVIGAPFDMASQVERYLEESEENGSLSDFYGI